MFVLVAPRNQNRALVVLVSVLTFGLASQASASTITTITITGQVSSVDAALASYFTVGEAFTASWEYTPATSTLAVVSHPFQNLVATVGNDQFSRTSHINGFTVKNNVPFDELMLEYVAVSGLNIPGLDPPRLLFALADFTSSAFSNASLPSTLPPLAFWGSVQSFLAYEDPVANASRRVNFSVTSMSTVTTPEPTSLLLLGTGGLALAAKLRRRRKQNAAV